MEFSTGGCYDTAKRNVIEFINTYENFLYSRFPHVKFDTSLSIKSPDPTTLFCTSGMQQFKQLFSNLNYSNTISNIQRCLRLNDLEEIGDSTHYLVFHMLGFFSFRQLSVREVIKFWLDFMEHIGLYPHYVTIHPDKIEEWSHYYPKSIDIRPDIGCLWSDGNIGGYCTEFYYNGVEIGNIVNPLGNCIDVGFGVERLLNLKYNKDIISREDILLDCIENIIDCGYEPSPNRQGFILRKLLIELSHSQKSLNHPFYEKIVEVQLSQYHKYKDMTQRSDFYKRKTREWWKNSFGVDIDNLNKYEKLLKKHPNFS